MWTQWLFRFQCLLLVVIAVALIISKLSASVNINLFLAAALSMLGVILLGVIGLLGLLVSYVFSKRGWRKYGLYALVTGLVPLLVFSATVGFRGFSKPVIHDISTDLQEPPVFVAALTARNANENSLDYGGPELAKTQKQAYPDIKPLFSTLNKTEVFNRSLQTIESLGWTVLAKDAESGRIEAYERSLLFGFVDDVVIRIRASDNGSRVDVRSVSRIGEGDFGANAERVRRFLAAMQ